jgi:hypothetical protein
MRRNAPHINLKQLEQDAYSRAFMCLGWTMWSEKSSYRSGFIESGSRYVSGFSISNESRSRVLMTKYWRIKKQLKIAILSLHKGRPSYRREAYSLQKRTYSTKKTKQLFTCFYFYGSFLPSWIQGHH